MENEAKSRDRLPGLILESRVLHDPKVQTLLDNHGCEGLAVMLGVWLAIADSSEARLDEGLVSAVRIPLGVEREKFQTVCATLLKLGLVYKQDKHFHHYKIDEQLSSLLQRRARWRKAQGRNRAPAKPTKPRVAKPAQDLALPAFLAGAESPWQEFCEYRSEARKPVSSKAAQGIFKKFENVPAPAQAFAAACVESVANQWQGVFPPKGSRNGVQKTQTNFDAARRLAEKYKSEGV